MPYKVYHGKTGVVYNVTKSAVGVIIYKKVGNRYMEKRVNVRVEHIAHSRSREECKSLWNFLPSIQAFGMQRRKKQTLTFVPFLFLATVINRVKSNAARRREAKEKGESVQLKRQPVGPRSSRVVELSEVESLAPQPYDTHI